MTTDDRRRLELLDDDTPPPTPAQQQWIREAIHAELVEQLKPIAATWDARSADMLDVLELTVDKRQQVRSAVKAIKVAAGLGVIAFLASGLLIWQVLISERADRRAFREAERQRRVESTQLIIEKMHDEALALDALAARRDCSKPAN